MAALLAAMLVVCAPGNPGTTAEAQTAMDALARSFNRVAGAPEGSYAAVYEETDAGCLRRLSAKETVLVLSTLPFALEHEQDLHLTARLSAMPQGGEPLEKWTLVAGKDHPAALDGYTVQSTAGYSKRFVRAMAPKLPAGVQVEPVQAVLSALRRSANGEKIAVLLDGAQTASLGTLPFAASLAPVETSPPVPVAILYTVGKRIDDRRWSDLEVAFLKLAEDRAARNALDGVRLAGFVPLDAGALSAARTAYRRAR
jgi:hypothetical protein